MQRPAHLLNALSFCLWIRDDANNVSQIDIPLLPPKAHQPFEGRLGILSDGGLACVADQGLKITQVEASQLFRCETQFA